MYESVHLTTFMTMYYIFLNDGLLTKDFFQILLCILVYVSLCHAYTVSAEVRDSYKGDRPPIAVVTGSCEESNVGAGN